MRSNRSGGPAHFWTILMGPFLVVLPVILTMSASRSLLFCGLVRVRKDDFFDESQLGQY